MNDIQRFMYWHLSLSRGIIPVTERHDAPLSHPFRDMSPEEARTCKRKFRKIWRKLVKTLPPFEGFYMKEEPWRRKQKVYEYLSRLAREKTKKGDFSV